jgi:transcription elongation factor GreA
VEGTSLDYGRFLHAKVLRNRGFTDQTKQALLDVIEAEHPNIYETEATEERAGVSPSADVVYTTLAGYHRQETELRQVVEVEIPEVATELGRAASFGDISENAEYSAALDKQERIMRRLGELRDALDRARILEPDEVTTERVVIGTRVRLLNKGSGVEETFSLLGPWDVDLEKGIISYMSPVGRGLLGKKCDDEVEIELPEAGSVEFKVLGIEMAPNLMADEDE